MRRVPSRRPAGRDPIEPQIEAALQPGSFIKYRAVWPFVEGLEQVEKKIAELVRKAPAQAVALYETFRAGCYERPKSSTIRVATSACLSTASSVAGSGRARRPVPILTKRPAASSLGWMTTRTAFATKLSVTS